MNRIWEIWSDHGRTGLTAYDGLALELCPGVYPGGMVNDETDSCISERFQNVHPGKVNYWVNDLPGVQHAVKLGPCEQALSISSAIILKLTEDTLHVLHLISFGSIVSYPLGRCKSVLQLALLLKLWLHVQY